MTCFYGFGVLLPYDVVHLVASTHTNVNCSKSFFFHLCLSLISIAQVTIAHLNIFCCRTMALISKFSGQCDKSSHVDSNEEGYAHLRRYFAHRRDSEEKRAKQTAHSKKRQSVKHAIMSKS